MLSTRIFRRLIIVCVLQIFSVDCNSENYILSNETSRSRHKRTLNFYFPYNSCYALAVVMVLPLEDLPVGQSVFCSYNFETNYYYPYFDNANGIIPLPFTWIDEPGANAGTKHRIDLPPANRQFSDDIEAKESDVNDQKVTIKKDEKVEASSNDDQLLKKTKKLNKDEGKTTTRKPKAKAERKNNKSRKVRSLLNNYFMSRRRFYTLMESKMDRSGIQGRYCILKAICDTAEASFGLHNGVIGSVIDILFLPSASKDEKLPKRYYRAESNGKSGKCDLYKKDCPKSLFDFITKII